jgi:hypothetical protein
VAAAAWRTLVATATANLLLLVSSSPIRAGGLAFVEQYADRHQEHVLSTVLSPDDRHESVALFQRVAATCPSAPSTGCRQPFTNGTSTLKLHDDANDVADRGRWRWVRGESTTFEEFGSDPLTVTDYTLCLYDGSVLAQPRLEARAPAGGLCRGRSCWRTTASGRYRYRDTAGTPHGLRTPKLKPGGDGESQISAKVSGVHVAMPGLPLTLPVRAQLVNSEGGCWEATFSTAATNDGVRFDARWH